jgi:hypothetical protein
MRTRGLVKTFLAVGFAVAVLSEGAHATPLAGGMRGQNVTKIYGDRGGYVIQYAMRLQQLKQAGSPVQFTGACMSDAEQIPWLGNKLDQQQRRSFSAAYYNAV